MPTLYESHFSGNCYKVRLVCAQLAIPLQLIEIDLFKKQTRTEDFLELNPNGRVPLLRLDDGTLIPESNAIMWYLAEGTPLIPTDRLARTRVLQWLFFEQYSHEPYVAVLRAWKRYFGVPPNKEHLLPEMIDKAYAALAIMDAELSTRPFMVGNEYSLADIALYAYTHVARDGALDLDRFPSLLSWLTRIQSQPNHISIED